jgi:hypothetical protein
VTVSAGTFGTHGRRQGSGPGSGVAGDAPVLLGAGILTCTIAFNILGRLVKERLGGSVSETLSVGSVS